MIKTFLPAVGFLILGSFSIEVGGGSGKEPTSQSRRYMRQGFDPWVGKIPWRRAWEPTSVFLPREPHGKRSLAGYMGWQRIGHG